MRRSFIIFCVQPGSQLGNTGASATSTEGSPQSQSIGKKLRSWSDVNYSGKGEFSKFADQNPRDGHYTDEVKSGGGSGSQGDLGYFRYVVNEAKMGIERKNKKFQLLADVELDKLIGIKRAANILGIKEDELPGLKPMRVETAFREAYGPQSNAHEVTARKDESAAAARVLLEFIDSKLYVKHTQHHYEDLVEKLRIDVHDQKQKDKDAHLALLRYIVAAAISGLGLYFLALVYHAPRMSKEEAKSTMSGVFKTYELATGVNENQKGKAIPDYATRYRETPTTRELESRRKTSHVLNRDALSLRVHQDKEQADAIEARELARMVVSENEMMAREEHGRKLAETTWVIDPDSPGTGDAKNDEAIVDDARNTNGTRPKYMSSNYASNSLESRLQKREKELAEDQSRSLFNSAVFQSKEVLNKAMQFHAQTPAGGPRAQYKETMELEEQAKQQEARLKRLDLDDRSRPTA